MLEFGVTVLPDPPQSRFFELVDLTEQHGFDYVVDLRLAHPLAGVLRDPARWPHRGRRRSSWATS